MLMELSRPLGLVVGAVLAVVVTAAGLAERVTPLVVVGVLGFLQFTNQSLRTFIGGPVSSFGVVIVGLALVVVVVVRAVRRGRPQPPLDS
jgi:hypothetical protein